jgi:hypothetical protein
MSWSCSPMTRATGRCRSGFPASEGESLWQLLDRPPGEPSGLRQLNPDPRPRDLIAENLASRLLRAAGATVTGVDVDELGPGVLAARSEVTSPAGGDQLTAGLGRGLALAAAMDAPIRVADPLMSRLAVPVPGDDLLGPFLGRRPAPARPRRTPGRGTWTSPTACRTGCSAAASRQRSPGPSGRTTPLLRPAGSRPCPPQSRTPTETPSSAFAAGDYRSATMSLHAEVRTKDVTGQARLRLRTLTEGGGGGHGNSRGLTGSHDWTRHDVTPHRSPAAPTSSSSASPSPAPDWSGCATWN